MSSTNKKPKNRKSNHIKQIVKMAYLFGCFSRKDMSQFFLVGEDTLNREYGRLYDVFEEMDQIQIPRVGNESEMVLFRDRLNKQKMEFLNVYHTVMVPEIVQFRCEALAQIMEESRTVTAQKLTDKMYEIGAYDMDSDEEDDQYSEHEEKKKIRNNTAFLEAMCELGFLKKEKKLQHGRRVYIRPNSILDTLTNREKEDLAGFLDYCTQMQGTAFFGHQILKQLPKVPTVFTYTRSLEYMVLDEERLFEIREIAKQYPLIRVSFVEVNRNNQGWLKGRTEAERILYPWAFLLDRKYGRSYLLGYANAQERMEAIPLDRVRKVAGIRGERPTKEELEQAYQRQFGHAWLAGGKTDPREESIVVSLSLSAAYANKCEFRLRSEGITDRRKGKLYSDQEGNLHYEVIVDNWIDMIPWIRSFGGYLSVESAVGMISGRNYGDEIRSCLRSTWEEALKNYDEAGII